MLSLACIYCMYVWYMDALCRAHTCITHGTYMCYAVVDLEVWKRGGFFYSCCQLNTQNAHNLLWQHSHQVSPVQLCATFITCTTIVNKLRARAIFKGVTIETPKLTTDRHSTATEEPFYHRILGPSHFLLLYIAFRGKNVLSRPNFCPYYGGFYYPLYMHELLLNACTSYSMQHVTHVQ